MSEEAASLLDALDTLASRIEPGARKRLASEEATALRAANAKRLRANVQPPGDGPMAPRKPREAPKGSLRSARMRDQGARSSRAPKRGRMFKRAASPKYLHKRSNESGLSVGFDGALSRIMEVHQYGRTDRVSRVPGAPLVAYPARTVLGFDDADRTRLLERLHTHLGG